MKRRTPWPTGRPRQSDLKRAISTAYYALFHALALMCADILATQAGRENPLGGRFTGRRLRHRADYDPVTGFMRSEVSRHVIHTEDILKEFRSASINVRREFAIFVLLRLRP